MCWRMLRLRAEGRSHLHSIGHVHESSERIVPAWDPWGRHGCRKMLLRMMTHGLPRIKLG